MGFLHHIEGPPPPAEVALNMPRLSDRTVAYTLQLAEAYQDVRRALLALSGISLMQNLGMGSPGSLSGVVVTARDALDQARDSLAGSESSGREGVQLRTSALLSAVEVLDEQAATLVADGYAEIDSRVLNHVRQILAQCAVPDAGLRHFTSVSCAGYPSARENLARAHGHSHGHDHDHHVHSHAQSIRTSTQHLHATESSAGRPAKEAKRR